MDEDNDADDLFAVRAELAKLRQEHEDLDAAVQALQSLPVPD